MNSLHHIRVISILTLLLYAMMSFFPITNFSEAKYLCQNVSISIKGTSTLHDWEMKSAEGICEAVFDMGPDNKINSLNGLMFSLPAKSLKSGHSLMDKNTYKALKATKHANISFVLSSAAITQIEADTYEVKGSGKLTIAGNTHETEITATGKWIAADNSIIFSGTKKMKMTEYNVQPPTVMMGTIKTGDEISIIYNLKLNK